MLQATNEEFLHNRQISSQADLWFRGDVTSSMTLATISTAASFKLVQCVKVNVTVTVTD